MNPLAHIVDSNVLQRDTGLYEHACKQLMWNGRVPAHCPDMIIQAASETDVVRVIDYARLNKRKLSIRGGGHNWCGPFMDDDRILLDLSRLDKVLSIDASAKTAVVQPGVSNRDLARRLALHHLAFPVGHCSPVTLSGYLLGGGFGWNTGSWGVACFNVLELQVVTADGRLRKASPTENPDLFWAARGAGPGFFGVVTQYTLRLFDLPPEIRTSTLVFALDDIRQVLPWLEHTAQALPAHVEMILVMAKAPPELRRHTKNILRVTATAFAHSEAQAAEALAPIDRGETVKALLKTIQVPTPFDTLFEMLDQAYPKGKRVAADTLWLAGDPVTQLSTAAQCLAEAPSADSHILALILPPPPADAPPLPEAAFSMVAPLFIACYAMWDQAEQDHANTLWLQTSVDLFRSATVGHYLGETDLRAGVDRAARSFAAPNWEKLCALKQKYDPQHLFRWFAGNAPSPEA
jgi:FAD/FMN-containing dehydrogenase